MTLFQFAINTHLYQVLVFGPESVSYERSRRETAAKFHHFSARVFFVKISKSQDSMIYTIFSFFRIHIPKMDSFANVSVTRPGRPAARPSVMDHRLSNWFVFQYFSVHRLSNWFLSQYFSVPKLSRWIVFQYFHNSNQFRRDFQIEYYYFQ